MKLNKVPNIDLINVFIDNGAEFAYCLLPNFILLNINGETE